MSASACTVLPSPISSANHIACLYTPSTAATTNNNHTNMHDMRAPALDSGTAQRMTLGGGSVISKGAQGGDLQGCLHELDDRLPAPRGATRPQSP